MIHVLNAESARYCEEARAVLESFATVEYQELDRAGLLAAVGRCDALIVRFANQIDEAVFDAAPRLKAIVSATTGLDHIDQARAARQGVTVLSLQGERAFLDTVHATAEHAWALLLAVMRKLPAAAAHVRHGGWDRYQFLGNELADKKLGVVGLGRLGVKVARYGEAFGMSVGAFDPHPEANAPGVRRFPTVEALFDWAEVVSLHAPSIPSTHGLVDASLLARLAPGAVLINTARGALLDEAALLAALESGRLGGAGLDVIASEAEGRIESPLFAYAREHDNLVITPHVGGATRESMRKTEVFMAEKLKRFFMETGQVRP